ncbi:hypothetical protein NDU88_005103 [Pleurodeles waltl]|uniref:Uncharacterized protein n=1 Tax=Pleurodeles waltl TaxID=8319 RepID=A0AAV7SKQ9_PLEWA|nr:hypothetical protein NDU88_005103 [Pleurodeles waltl]
MLSTKRRTHETRDWLRPHGVKVDSPVESVPDEVGPGAPSAVKEPGYVLVCILELTGCLWVPHKSEAKHTIPLRTCNSI